MNIPPPPGSWEGSSPPIRQYHAGPIPPEIYEDYPDGHGGPNPRQVPHRTSHAPGPYLLPQYPPQIAVQQSGPSASHNIYHAAPIDRMSSHSDHHGSLWPPQQVFDQSQSQPQHPTNAYPYTADSVTYASGLTAPYAEGGPGPGSSSTYDPLSALPSSSQSSSPLGHGLPPSAMSYGMPSTSGDFSNHEIPRGTLTPSAIYSESTIISYGTGSAPTNGTVVQEIKGSQSIYRSAGYGPMNPHHQDDPYSYPDPRYAGAVDVYGYPTGPQVKMKRKQVKVACSNCQQTSKRCDEGRPCERCIHLHREDTCVDGPQKKRGGGKKHKKDASATQSVSPAPTTLPSSSDTDRRGKKGGLGSEQVAGSGS